MVFHRQGLYFNIGPAVGGLAVPDCELISRALDLCDALFDRAQAFIEAVPRDPECAILSFESSLPMANGGFESYSDLLGTSFGYGPGCISCRGQGRLQLR
jgi:hypothetical protein